MTKFSTRLSLLLFITLLSAPSLAQEYLPPDLRSRVDQLKSELNERPTNATNASSRAYLTWEWLNAYAVDGGYLPVNATQVIASVLAADRPRNAVMAGLDAVMKELAFIDDFPDGIGQLTADTGPFNAQSWATIRQIYTVGKTSIQTGGGIMLARHFMTNFGTWQVTDPSGDNYISIASSNKKVSFVATSAPLRGMHGGFRNTRPTLVFKIASGTLTEGDTVTITYGDQSQGSRGLMMPSFSSDRMPLPLYLAFNESGQYMSLPIQPVRIIGQAATGVAGFFPSIVTPGEKFAYSVRAQDPFFNRATDAIPDWRLALNGAPWVDLNSTGAITTATASITEPGVYYVSIESADGRIKGESNPILVTADPAHRIYWGDTHGHSGFAEGIGTPDRFMQWAKEDARLDYVTHSEHDIWLDDAEWEVLRENVQKYSKDGEFVAFLGYEWTVNNLRGGHHNVLFRTPERRNRIPAQFYPTLSRLYQGLRANADPQDVVVIPHAHQAGDYRISDPELEPLVEIMSQHGNFEWFGRMYLQHGHQVGFTAASDNHLSQPGYSAPQGGSLSQRGGLGAIMATSKTTNGIFDAMKQLRSYATTGDRIILDFTVNDTPMGQRAPFEEERTIAGRVIGTAPLDTIAVIKNEQEIWRKSYLTNSASKLGSEATLLLSFASDSEPFHSGDNPRGWRAWEGTLEVVNADLVQLKPQDASFPLQTVTPSDEINRVTFATKTRGDTSSYLITLANIQRNARIQFDLIETAESGGAPPVFRPQQRVPAASFSFALRDMKQGVLEYTQQVDQYTDRARLRKIVTSGEREIEFSFTDSSARQGDYYFLRVVQANDAIAWSSPVWVGGYPAR